MSPLLSLRLRPRTLSVISICIILVAIALVWSSRQHAAGPITVNSTSDATNANDGLCTLREAIAAANHDLASGAVAGECVAGSATDVIDATGITGTINLSSPLESIISNMTINGPGSSQLTVRRDTGGDYRIFQVGGSAVFTISGVTITNGKTPDGLPGFNSGGNGGGIMNLGALTLNDVTVTGNATGKGGDNPGGLGGRGGSGGGIYSNAGTSIIITNSSITNNIAGRGGDGSQLGEGGNGGGVAFAPSGNPNTSKMLTMTNCTVSGNAAGNSGTGASSGFNGGSGGGIYIVGNAIDGAVLSNLTISNNAAGDSASHSNGGSGGGVFVFGGAVVQITNSTIANDRSGNNSSGFGSAGQGSGLYVGSAGSLSLSRSTISNNTGSSSGGGVYNEGTLTISNSTISNNSAGMGGGISNSSGTGDINNCTVIQNAAVGRGGGVYNGGTFRTRNSIIALNNGTIGTDFNITITSQGHNLIGVSEFGGVTPAAGDLIGTSGSPIDPSLGPLQNNGGATKTHAPLANSPALDAGDDCVTQAAHCGDPNLGQLTIDQRGLNRIVDGPDADATATVDIGACEGQVPLSSLPDTSTNEDTQLSFGFDPGDPSTITSVTATSSNSTLVPNDLAHLSASSIGVNGNVVINPATNANGTTNITITVNRSIGGPDSKTFLLTVNSVNDGPSFTKGADQIVNEDAGAQSITNWASNISAGPANESVQTLSFQITNNTNAALFSAGPAVSSSGTLTYTPAANANGSATITLTVQDNGGVANGGVNTSASQSFTITVTAVNDVPSFTKGADQTVNEDPGPQAVNNWATNLSAGPANESGQTLSFQITNNTNASLFAAGPAISSTGTLTYAPALDANGSATISVVIKDNGGTGNGGVDTSAVQTFNITVNPVNDAPSFNVGSVPVIIEDAGPQTISNLATAISAGPANESGQSLTFQIVSNTNTLLFSAGPAVASDGTLTYTPAANANGIASITINLKDNGGTASGGVDTSSGKTFLITVNAVNDAPSFTKGADQTVNNNAGAQAVTNWATGISVGPSNESAQSLSFQVTNNTNIGLFSVVPAVSSTGTLNYTPATSGGGTATITINLRDSGGTANGGVDTSASQTFNITVTPVGGFVNFQSSTGNATENSGSTTVNVVRTGDTSLAATVNYATNADAGVPCSTSNGVASPKCDFTAALGTLSFAAGETSKPITILISQDSFVEAPEAITLTLSSPTGGAALGTPSSMSVTILDDVTEAPGNIIDDANMFVQMHYHDFLNREGDQSGLGFWTGQMTNCGSSDLTVCRVNVSGAFFVSIEFQQTGYLVERMYKTGYGDAVGTSNIGGSHQIFMPVVRANEFLTETQRVGRGLVVGQPGWETVLENNKQAYALEFVQTSRFTTALPTTMTPAQFVDKLNQNAGGVLSVSERTTAINLFGNSANTTNVTARAQVLRQIAEDQDLYQNEFNRAFVLAEYIGYLRRNPNDAPESTLDYSGYEFWLGKLAENGGDYIKAEMVKAFISSDEYRKRFGP